MFSVAARQRGTGIRERAIRRTWLNTDKRYLSLRPSLPGVDSTWRRPPWSLLSVRRLQHGPMWGIHRSRGVHGRLRRVHLCQKTRYYNSSSLGAKPEICFGVSKFFISIKLQYSCTIAVLTSFLPRKKFTWTDFWGIYTHIPPVSVLATTRAA